MRLYSKHQVVGIVLVAAAVASVGTLALESNGLLSRLFFEEAVAAQKTANDEATNRSPSLELLTNSPADPSSPAEARTVADSTGYTQDELQNITVYKNAKDAVVNITTETVGINWFLEPVPQEGASGSGSIIDTRGYVVTNSHVISDATKIFVSLADGSQYEGTVVGVDKENDIAVLKFEPPKDMTLTTIPFADSSSLVVGQKVLAIGNPFGFDRTLTTGIVSALGRPIMTQNNTIIKNMIQTDTAINPGNSGGPLLDTKGRMIGINTIIYSTSGSSAGVGFSIPVNTAKRVVAELIQYGKVKRGSIDASLVQLNSSIANYAKLSTDKGLLVSQVAKGSQAEKAGLKGGTDAVRYGSGRNNSVIYLGGDVITAIAGQKIESLTDYYSVLESKKPGDAVEITVLRGRQQVNLKMTLAERAN